MYLFQERQIYWGNTSRFDLGTNFKNEIFKSNPTELADVRFVWQSDNIFVKFVLNRLHASSVVCQSTVQIEAYT